MLLDADFPSGSPGLYGTDQSKLLDGRYAQIGNTSIGGDLVIVDDPDPNITGNVIRFNADSYGGGTNYNALRRALRAGITTTLGSLGRFWLSRLPNNANEVPIPIMWKDGANVKIALIAITTTGSIQAQNAAGAVLGETAGPVITANGWWHIEAQLTCSLAAGGTLTVWVEGQQVLALAGLTTTVAGTSQYEIANDPSGASSAPAMYLKDHVTWDGTGAANNSKMGPVIVCDLTEDGDVSGGWTSTAANKWSTLDESGPNDADYIDAATPPPADQICTLTNLPANIVAIRGLVSVVRAWKTDGGDGNLTVGLSPDAGAHWDDGTDHAVSAAATYFTDASDVSPNTGAAYTPVEVNAADIRFKRTA
jgi:hypothetical protein